MKKYKINEIFYSLQGEGYFTGVPAIFIRFSGCNLRCPFCDTDHHSYTEMTAEEIAQAISEYPAETIILTGGEPTLFADKEFIETIKKYYRGELQGGKIEKFDFAALQQQNKKPQQKGCLGLLVLLIVIGGCITLL